jgi:hypothetical protein
LLGIKLTVQFIQQTKPHHKQARRDLERGMAEVVRVTTAHVIEVEERDDDGPRYFFDIGNGQSLFIGGQWLWDRRIYRPSIANDAEVPFPAQQFELHRGPESGEPFAIVIQGERITAAEVCEWESVSCPDIQTAIVDAPVKKVSNP